MAMEAKDKVFKSELVVMSLQPASSNIRKPLPNEGNPQNEEVAQQDSLQLKSPTKTTSSTTDISYREGNVVNIQCTSENFDSHLREKIQTNGITNKTPASKVDFSSRTVSSSQNLYLDSGSSRHLEDFKLASSSTYSSEFVSKNFDNSWKEGNFSLASKVNVEKSENVQNVASEEKLVLPAGIQDLLYEDLESDASSHYSLDEDIEQSSVGDTLDLPLGIQELINGSGREQPKSSLQAKEKERRRSVSDLKDIFVNKIEEAAGGRRSSDSSDVTDVSLIPGGTRSRSGSVSSEKVAIPEGIKELITGGNSVKNKASVFEAKVDDRDMEKIKLSSRDKINVDFVGKKFKQIQKSMKNTSEMRDKVPQKPILPAVGVNSKIKAFEKNEIVEKHMNNALISNRKHEMKYQNEPKTSQQMSKDLTDIHSSENQINLESAEEMKRPPLAQSLLNKVLMETPKLAPKGMSPIEAVSAPKPSNALKPYCPKQHEVPLAQQLLMDVVRDIKQDVQKQEENGRLFQQAKYIEVVEAEDKLKPFEATFSVMPLVAGGSDSKGKSNSSPNGKTTLLLDENCSEGTSKVESLTISKPQESDKRKRLRVRRPEGPSLSIGGVQDTGGSENTGAIGTSRQGDREELSLPVQSSAGGDEVTQKLPSVSTSPSDTPTSVKGRNQVDKLNAVHEAPANQVVMEPEETTDGLDTIENCSIPTLKCMNRNTDRAVASTVSKLASNSNDDNQNRKTPKNTATPGSQSSVFNIINKIQRSTENKKESLVPKGRVKISPKFNVERNTTISTLKSKDVTPAMKEKATSENGTGEKPINGKLIDDQAELDERDMRDKEFREEVAEKLKRLSLSHETNSEDDGHPQESVISLDTLTAGSKAKAVNSYGDPRPGAKSKEVNDVNLQDLKMPKHENGMHKPSVEGSEIIRIETSGLESDITNYDDFTEDIAGDEREVPNDEKEIYHDHNLLSVNEPEIVQLTESLYVTNDPEKQASKGEPRLPVDQFMEENTVKLDRTSVIEPLSNNTELTLIGQSDTGINLGVVKNLTLSPQNVDAISENDQQSTKRDTSGKVNDVEGGINTVPSFTKHELFFASDNDLVDEEAENKSVDYSDDDSDSKSETDQNKGGRCVTEQMEGDHRHEALDHNDNVDHIDKEWTKVESGHQSDIELDTDEMCNRYSGNNSLSTSTVSLDSVQSSELNHRVNYPVINSPSSTKSSGNKMSKPDIVNQHEHIKKLEELDINKENVISKSLRRKTIDITVFEALKAKYNTLQRRHEQTEMDLMQARLVATAIENEYDEDEVDGDSIYRQKYEKLKREMDFMKKKLEQQHEEEVEKKDLLRKQLERKLGETMADNEEQKRQVTNLKRKSQRLNADMQDIKLHLEEQVTRNSELEKKQRKFDTEVQKVNTVLLQEKQYLSKTQKERDEIVSERFTLEQELKNVKLEYELQTEKLQRLEKQLQEISSAGSKDDKELFALKRLKADLEAKVQEQEEELDEQAGVIQQLEQTKLRLEMNKEKLRQEHNRELEEKEQEMETMRASSQKKLKSLESQLEEEYTEKQSIGKEKRELERKLKEINDLEPEINRDVEQRLRRNLKRTKALWRDAQMMLEKQKDGVGGRGVVKQLRNQLEDAEIATAAAVKARKGFEMEITELQQQLDDISKSKQEVEERYMALSREKNDIQSQLDDHEEEYAELMKKYKAVVAQQSVDQMTIQEQSNQIEELQLEKEQLNEQLVSLQSQVEFMQTSMVDKQLVVRLESKVRDLESKLELEQTTRHRAESSLARLKEQVEKLTEDKDKLSESEQRNTEANKRLSRQLRDVKDELADVQRHEGEATQRKHDLEKKVESLESDFEQSQSDLRLAFKRIADLQTVMEDEMDSDLSDYDSDGEFEGESDTDSSVEMPSFLVNHKSAGSSRRTSGYAPKISTSSGDTSMQSRHNGHGQFLLENTGESADC